MAEDLHANLSNYKLQLQQVEAALTTDEDNEDLQKLKKDLQEVIDLTEDLIRNQAASSGAAGEDAGTPDGVSLGTAAPVHNWKVGDTCVATFTEDGMQYPATIDEILEDGTCTVTFEGYGNTEVTQVNLLRLPEEDKGNQETGEPGAKKPKTKKDMQAAQREYKKKKAEKKRQRLKQLEEERETEKNKWLSFNSKVFSKTSKGKVRKSIFASPESVEGRVGIGTCGMSGKPMTEFTHQEKWKKQ